MYKNFCRLFLISMLTVTAFAEIIYKPGMTNRKFAELTNDDYWKTVRPHQKLMERLGEYVNNNFVEGSDMHQLYNNIIAIEGLTNDKNFVGKKASQNIDNFMDSQSKIDDIIDIVAYTDNLFALACGAKVNYDARQSGSLYGKITKGAMNFGANHGLDMERESTLEDAQLIMAGMIHSRLSESSYFQDHLPTIDYMVHNTTNGIIPTDDEVRKHRLSVYAFQLLTGGFDYALNEKAGVSRKVQIRRLLTSQDDAEEVWDDALKFVENLYTHSHQNPWKNATSFSYTNGPAFFIGKTKPLFFEQDRNYLTAIGSLSEQKLNEDWEYVKDILVSYKEEYIELYTAISNIVNAGRKFYVYREIPQRILDEEAKAEQAKLDALKVKMAADANAIQDDDIVVGQDLEEKIKNNEIAFELAKGSFGLSFENPGGAGLLKTALEELPTPVYSATVPYYILNKNAEITESYLDVRMSSKAAKKYLLMKAPGKSKEYVQEQYKGFTQPGVFIFSTHTPGIDGVYAYIPKGAMGNATTMFEMISTPLAGNDIKDAIGVKNPDYLRKLARTIHNMFTGGNKANLSKDAAKKSSLAPLDSSAKGIAKDWRVAPSNVGGVTITKLKGGSIKHGVQKDKGYIPAYKKASKSGKVIGRKTKATKTSVSVTISSRAFVSIPKAQYEKLKGGTLFQNGHDLAGKTLDNLLEEGFFRLFKGGLLFYVHSKFKREDGSMGYKLYMLSDTTPSEVPGLREFGTALGGTAKILDETGKQLF